METGWYLVFTKARHENVAQRNLQRQGFNLYLPFLQQHKRRRNFYQIVTEPLFPRYLFIHLNFNKDDWSKIRSTRGCVSLVRFGELPARVPDKLIDKLKKEEPTRSMENSSPAPTFKTGDKVTILEGILTGYEGIVQIRNSEQRVTLLLTIAEDHTRSVNLPVHQIEMARN